jgi:hypothetical protein
MLDEIASLRTLLDLANQTPGAGSLVVLDIDQTLLVSEGMYASEPWYEWLVEQNVQKGMAETVAVWAANAEWEKAGRAMDFVPIEPDAPRWLGEWEKKGHAMGLTARDQPIAARTREHLNGGGFVLNGAVGAPATLRLAGLGAYEGGVLYVGPVGEKGPALAAFLLQLPRMPERVYFADDKMHHVLSVRKVLGALGIAVTAARFTAADRLAALFDPTHARREQAAGKPLKRSR